MTTKNPKSRLDDLLVSKGLFDTVEEARAHILAGEVWTGQNRLDKAGEKVAVDIPLTVKGQSLKFVSRAGYKLEHALDSFGIDVTGRTCLDVGSSTGGFTDCLLQRGARHVFAVDVGTGQLHQRLREHAQVTVREKTNARDLRTEALVSDDGKITATDVRFICGDVSFISLRKIIPAVRAVVTNADTWLILFKPQFELRSDQIGQGGIVRDPNSTIEALKEFEVFMSGQGLKLAHPAMESPLAGKKSGNVEILLHFEESGK